MQTLNSSSIITRYKNTNKTFYFKFSDLEIQTVPMTDYINIYSILTIAHAMTLMLVDLLK